MRPEFGAGVFPRARGPWLWSAALALLFIVNFEPGRLVAPGLMHDDASYVAHAFTLGLDLDLDYSNEAVDKWNGRRTAPSHPMGPGIAAAPFVAVLGTLDRVAGHAVIEDRSQARHSWSLFGVLLAASAWFLVGVICTWKSLQALDARVGIGWALVLPLGTGITYYVLRRFTMAHAFEFGAVAMLLWCGVRVPLAVIERRSLIGWTLACAGTLALSLTMRHGNASVLAVLPVAALLMIHLERSRLARTDVRRILAAVTAATAGGLLVMMALNDALHGAAFPSVLEVYGSDPVRGASAAGLFARVLALSPNMVPLLVSSEFGLVYTNPVLVAGVSALLVITFARGLRERSLALLVAGVLALLAAGFSFATVLFWRSTASAYGYRYLLALYPLSVAGLALLWNEARRKNWPSRRWRLPLAGLCAVAFASQLFFQVTPALSTTSAVNVFGIPHRYNARGYLTSLPREILRPHTWLRLLGTRMPGFLAGPAIIDGPLAARVSASDRDDYMEKFGGTPGRVYFQTILLLAGWSAAGFWLGGRVRSVSGQAGAAQVRASKEALRKAGDGRI